MENPNTNELMQWSSNEWTWQFMQDGSKLFIAVRIVYSTPLTLRPKPPLSPNLTPIHIVIDMVDEQIDDLTECMSKLAI